MPYKPQRVRALNPDEIKAWFGPHLMQRLTWLMTHKERAKKKDELFDGECAFNECAYAAGMLSARFFIQFMGFKVEDEKLATGRDYFIRKRGGDSYEVKVKDLGGDWAEMSDLSVHEQELLARIWDGTNQGVAHMSDGSPHGYKWDDFHDTIDIVVRLLKKRLFNVVGREPTWHGKGWTPNSGWVRKQ